MKKISVLLIILISLTLFTSFALAQENQYDKTNKINITGVKEKTNSLVDKEIIIPENLQTITKIFFRVEEKATVSLIIIIALIWIILFIMLKSILEIMPFFDKKIGGSFIEISTSTIASIAITTLIGLGGVIKSFAIFFLNIGKSFQFLEEWSAGFLLFMMIFLTIIIFLTTKVMNWLHENIELGKAKKVSEDITLGAKVLSDTGKSVDKEFSE